MKKYTGLFILAGIFAIIGWDFYAISSSGKEASISWVIIEYSYQYPSLTFLVGFVAGHLFWRMKKPGAKNE